MVKDDFGLYSGMSIEYARSLSGADIDRLVQLGTIQPVGDPVVVGGGARQAVSDILGGTYSDTMETGLSLIDSFEDDMFVEGDVGLFGVALMAALGALARSALPAVLGLLAGRFGLATLATILGLALPAVFSGESKVAMYINGKLVGLVEIGMVRNVAKGYKGRVTFRTMSSSGHEPSNVGRRRASTSPGGPVMTG